MATISNLKKEDLLGFGNVNPEDNERKEAVLHAMNHVISQLIRVKKNDPKRFKRGVIILDMTCRKCGLIFGVKFTYQAYLAILQINKISLEKDNTFAPNNLITQLLENGKMATVPVVDTFRYGICCPSCVSQIKNGQIEKP